MIIEKSFWFYLPLCTVTRRILCSPARSPTSTNKWHPKKIRVSNITLQSRAHNNNLKPACTDHFLPSELEFRTNWRLIFAFPSQVAHVNAQFSSLSSPFFLSSVQLIAFCAHVGINSPTSFFSFPTDHHLPNPPPPPHTAVSRSFCRPNN